MLVVGTVLGLSLSLGGGVLAEKEPRSSESLPYEDARLLAEVLERVRQEYVEQVDDHQLIESAVRGMVMDLDPHSQFLDVDQFNEIRISTTGNYTGVGLEVSMQDGIVRVVAPIDGSPAARAGIRSGDVLLSIDGMPVHERSVADTVMRMRGRPGTPVEITMQRDGVEEPISHSLVRSHVQVRSVRAEMVAPDYGYLRITHFSETTYRDVRKAVTRLRRESRGELEGMVLDLRNNPGGVLEAAIEVADGFLDAGVIVMASGRSRDANFRHEARQGDLIDGARMIVLVNAGSASASEIVAGALQDHGRARVVGTRTFGKGSVQTVMPLSNGRAIKLTTSRYFTPSGASIQDSGIEPDILLDDVSQRDLLALSTKEHLTDPGQALLRGDRQLSAALSVLRDERVVQSRAD